jgi:hypothetical protein
LAKLRVLPKNSRGRKSVFGLAFILFLLSDGKRTDFWVVGEQRFGWYGLLGGRITEFLGQNITDFRE